MGGRDIVARKSQHQFFSRAHRGVKHWRIGRVSSWTERRREGGVLEGVLGGISSGCTTSCGQDFAGVPVWVWGIVLLHQCRRNQ